MINKIIKIKNICHGLIINNSHWLGSIHDPRIDKNTTAAIRNTTKQIKTKTSCYPLTNLKISCNNNNQNIKKLPHFND